MLVSVVSIPYIFAVIAGLLKINKMKAYEIMFVFNYDIDNQPGVKIIRLRAPNSPRALVKAIHQLTNMYNNVNIRKTSTEPIKKDN